MIPLTVSLLNNDFEIKEKPNFTYKIQTDKSRICGSIDGLDAVKQAMYKIMMTERYQYPIYSWNYGIELLDLYGEPISYVCPELERRITEALLWDERIQSVDNFEFDFPQKGVVHAVFIVHTIFGDIQAEKEIII